MCVKERYGRRETTKTNLEQGTEHFEVAVDEHGTVVEGSLVEDTIGAARHLSPLHQHIIPGGEMRGNIQVIA